MKILQMHIGLDIMGGIESFICYLSNELANNYDVTFCSIHLPKKSTPFFSRLNTNVKKEYLPIDSNTSFFRVIWKVYKFLQDSRVDIIHIHGFFYYYILAILLLHKKKKFVYTFHSDAYKENTKWDKKILWFKKYCIRQKWIYAVTISPQSKDSFTRLYHTNSRLIENGIQPSLINTEDNKIRMYRVNDKTRVFLHPGRICLEKNQVVLCRVFDRLIKEGYDVVLLIAGTIQSSDIYNDIKCLLSDRIKFLGERNDISQMFYHSDGFCLPSIWEGLPITLLEAISVGCPPICSPVGGIVSVVKHGINGVLSESPGEEDYYLAMKYFLNLSPDNIQMMKSECIKSFKRYDIKNTAQRYHSFYSELMRL